MKFILKRLAFYLVAFWVAITLNFAIPRAMPGDPATMMFIGLQGKMSPRDLAAMKRNYGFEEGVWKQYWVYLKKLSVGDFGISTMTFPQPVRESLWYAASWTFYLVGISTLISFVVGIAMGMYAAWNRGGFFDSFFTPFTVMGTAFSQPVVALLLFYGFAMEWRLFPLGRAHWPGPLRSLHLHVRGRGGPGQWTSDDGELDEVHGVPHETQNVLPMPVDERVTHV